MRAALFIGGKSMGGRIATQVAAAVPRSRRRPRAARLSAAPARQAEQRRDAHLPASATDAVRPGQP